MCIIAILFTYFYCLFDAGIGNLNSQVKRLRRRGAKGAEMFKKFFLAKEASYSDEGETLSDLKTINFIFGANGSGKTTISRVIADPESRPACKLKWANDRPLECLVYNTDFTKRNYAATLPGIFTLGEKYRSFWLR